MRFRTLGVAAVAALGMAATAEAARDEIRVTGSSTVAPFSQKVAEEFQNKTGRRVVVETTGSGLGHKQFCEGVGESYPDVTNSSRRQKKSEYEDCQTAGVTDIIEVKIGYDGIVIATDRTGADIDLSLQQIYLAFARDVPEGEGDGDTCTFVTNPYERWNQIDGSLPDARIKAFGPPPTSGTRDAFLETAMEKGARRFRCLRALRSSDEDAFKARAHTIREDGAWVDSGENDNAIVQKVIRTPGSVGIFGFSFLDQNRDKVKGASVGGVEPTFEDIASGEYPISRSLFFYVKKQHFPVIPGLKDYALEFTSEAAWGPGGYLEPIGLIPLSEDERVQYRSAVENETVYTQE